MVSRVDIATSVTIDGVPPVKVGKLEHLRQYSKVINDDRSSRESSRTSNNSDVLFVYVQVLLFNH
jgi:hypothetical protein